MVDETGDAQPVDGAVDRQAAMDGQSMLQAAGLVRTSMKFFQETAAALLAEMEYQAREFEAGRMPAAPSERGPALPTPPETHRKGLGCPIPKNAPLWTIVTCVCSAQWRRYPPGADGGAEWRRID